jgi:hypothetical protein
MVCYRADWDAVLRSEARYEQFGSGVNQLTLQPAECRYRTIRFRLLRVERAQIGARGSART